MTGNVFGFHNWPQMSFGISWVDTRDAAKHLTMHKVIHSLHSTKNYLDQNTNSSEDENLG